MPQKGARTTVTECFCDANEDRLGKMNMRLSPVAAFHCKVKEECPAWHVVVCFC